MKRIEPMKKRVCFPPRYLLPIVAVVAILFGRLGYAGSSQAEQDCFASDWPSELSTIEPDPSLLRGKLANGLRYVLKKNSEPENRVAIFLNVQAGSLNETDSQRGLAHFLEHMMFKGTANFPGDSLVEYFQSIGMNFGGDTNAHTTYEQTEYHLVLPNGSEKELDNGFLVVADYAGRAQLESSQIDKERGVILAEKRARDSAAYRTNVASTASAFRGTLLPERTVIGEEEILQKADRELLKSYYDAWYRPEKIILVVVGDMEPALAEGLIKKHFADLVPRRDRPGCPEFGELARRELESFYHYEPELGKTTVAIETFWDMPLQNDSLPLERQELIRYMGAMIMGYRLQHLQEHENSPFAHAFYGSSDIVERIGYGSLSAQTNPDRWQESLALLDTTLRQAIEYGFSDKELDRAKKEIKAELEARVLNEKTEDSREIARKIIRHLNSNRVYQSPGQEMELYGPMVEKIAADEVNSEFQAVWQHRGRLVSVVGDAQLGEDGARVVGDFYRKSQEKAVAGMLKQETQNFPYLTPQAAAKEAPKRSYYPEIDVEKLVFANGLIVNLKKTPYRENRVQVVANFGSGQQSEPLPGMAMLAEQIVNSSGSGRLAQSEVEALVAGSSVEWRFRIGESAFSWTGNALYKDFGLFIQILHTLLYDQGFRENLFGNVRTNVERMYQKVSRDIDGAMALNVQPFLAENNPHFGLPPWSEVAKLEFSSLEIYAATFSRPQDLEISVVGDFHRDEVVKVLEHYFGGVELQTAAVPKPPSINFPAGKTLQVKVNTSIDKSLVVVAWPTSDFWDISRTRRLHILAGILDDRLRKSIRETLGATYSPHVSSYNSRIYPGYGFIVAQMVVKPGMEEQIIAEVLKVGDSLHREGVSDEELIRTRKPMVTSLRDSVKTNQYWLSSVLGLSSRYPEQFEWPKTIIEDFSSATADEINRLAGKYLDNGRAAIARVAPDETAADPGKGEAEAMMRAEKESKVPRTMR
jgi:zinc protease